MALDDDKKAMDAAAAAGKGRKGLLPKAQPTPADVADDDDEDHEKGPPPRSGQSNLAARLSPAAHRPAARIASIEDNFNAPVAFRMAFIGSGQGGGRIASAFWDIGYRRVGVFNTTDQDFHGLPDEIPKLSLNIGGAGKDTQLARANVEGRDEEVRDLFTRAWGADPDCVLVCVSLGGGTGSGTAKPLVEMARKYMVDRGRPPRVGAVVSLPSPDDGQMIARNAVIAFAGLVEAKVSPLIVIDNERVHELYQPSMDELLPKSNELVSQLFHLFNSYAAEKSKYTSFDRSEFLRLLDGGLMVMGAADIPLEGIQSPADISGAIREQLANSVLARVDLKKGREGACVFVGNRQVLSKFGKDYFAAGFTMMDRVVGSAYDPASHTTVIHRGLYEGADDGLQCYVMVSGLQPPAERLADLARRAGLQLSTPSLAKFLKVE